MSGKAVDLIDAWASRLSLSARKPSVITHHNVPCRPMCMCVHVLEVGHRGKTGPSVLLNLSQEFSWFGVYITASSERGEGIKVFYVLNPTLQMNFRSSCNSSFPRPPHSNRIRLMVKSLNITRFPPRLHGPETAAPLKSHPVSGTPQWGLP